MFCIRTIKLQVFNVQQLLKDCAENLWNRFVAVTFPAFSFTILTNQVEVQAPIPLTFSWSRTTFTYLANQILSNFFHSFARIFVQRGHRLWILANVCVFQLKFSKMSKTDRLQENRRNAKMNANSRNLSNFGSIFRNNWRWRCTWILRLHSKFQSNPKKWQNSFQLQLWTS